MGAEKRSAMAYVRAVNEFIFTEDTPQRADVIFIPGNVHPGHVLRAAELYHAGYAPLIVPSGKYSITLGKFAGVPQEYRAAYHGEYATEWAYMRDVLLHAGVPEEAMLREDEATYTWENAQFSRKVCDARGLRVERALLCCHAPHARRAKLYYQAAFPETELLVCPCHVPGESREDWYLTAEGREKVLGEVSRCGMQVTQVLADFLLRDEQDAGERHHPRKGEKA